MACTDYPNNWPASLAELVSSRSQREFISQKKVGITWRVLPKAAFTCMAVHLHMPLLLGTHINAQIDI